MLWALVSSAFVIYLYRKLNAEQAPQAIQPVAASSIDVELDRLDRRLAQLEARLGAVTAQETAR